MKKYDFKHSMADDISQQRICDHQQCQEPGEFRAPKSRLMDRGTPNDYRWFCLAHIREFNKSWNFFEGMSDNEILKYKDEDITGHRPTWKMGAPANNSKTEFKYDDPFDFRRETGHDQFNERDANRRRSTEEVSFDAKDREAFAVLNLEPGCQIKDIKRRHKELAKKFHPDLHGGDKQAEEILKKINQAYTHLLSCGNS
ncbi:J domain-containing protein [Sneathiella sp.]|jgi:hypothetical protein|uniref:J domain-containing protein n=1 Tax=Sneathiella sp. TaxID=1964365 RepID=UPI0039E65CFD